MKKSVFILFFVFIAHTTAHSQCWKSIAAGYAHMFAIAENGTLWAWGKNASGELGDGTNVNKNLPVQVGTDTNWKEVSAGMAGIYCHTIAVKTDGTLWTWGSNTRGQLGDGTNISRNYPVQIGADTDWKTVAAGFDHSIAIKNNGTLWGWGNSSSFALIGFPSGVDVLAPEQRNMDTNWLKASAGDRVTLALKTNNTVWGWGYNQGDMLNLPAQGQTVQYPTQRQYNGTNVRHTTVGLAVSYDILTNNVLTQSGDIYNGTNPVYVKDADAGRYTVNVIKTNNTLWFIGKRMGEGTQVDYPLTQIGTANNWKTVSLGDQIAAGIDNGGNLWTWGYNFHGALGVGTNGVGVDSTVPLLVACPNALSNTNFNAASTLILFPNPAQNSVTLTANTAINRLIIMDVVGKELLSQTYSETSVEVDVSQFSKGVYFFQVFSVSGQSQIKFVKN